jgi:glutathione S-transferase
MAAIAFERVIERVFSALKAGDFLLGERLSAADILFASIFQWYRDFAPRCAELDAWLERLAARPAAKRAIKIDAVSPAN